MLADDFTPIHIKGHVGTDDDIGGMEIPIVVISALLDEVIEHRPRRGTPFQNHVCAGRIRAAKKYCRCIWVVIIVGINSQLEFLPVV